MKKVSFVFSIILILTCLLPTFLFSACKEDSFVHHSGFTPCELSQDGYHTFYDDEGDGFKILFLADPQIDRYYNSHAVLGSTNEDTFKLMEYLIEDTKPDLVALAGDLIASRGIDNDEDIRAFGDLFERLGVYWAPVFGNHDSETSYVSLGLQSSKEETLDILSEFDHCLLREGDVEEEGTLGNYFVNFRDKKGKLVNTLCCMDTVSDFENSTYFHQKTSAQTNWYIENINRLSDMEYGKNRNKDQVVQSMLMAHVPFPECSWAMNEYLLGNSEVQYHYGNMVEEMLPYTDDFFQTLVEIGSTKATFFGHYHSNDFSITYQGIRMTMVQHTSLNAYYRSTREKASLLNTGYSLYDFTQIDTFGDTRGGTVVEIKPDGQWTITPYIAKDSLSKYSEIAIDYDLAEQILNGKGTSVVRGIK